MGLDVIRLHRRGFFCLNCVKSASRRMETKQPDILYRSKRTYLLWFIVALAVGLLALTGWLVSLLSDEQLLKDFGSIAKGRAFQAGLLTIGSVFIWPMLWLSARYVVEISRSPSGVSISTWTLFGTRTETVPKDMMTQALTYHTGTSDFSTVDAPYLSLRIHGRKIIIDMQGEFPQGEEALTEALS
jgi:hypothetical protein